MEPLAFCKYLGGMKTAAEMPGEHAIQLKNKHKAVLLIEPDISVRDALTVLLEGEGWRVICLLDCHELLKVLSANGVMAVISESSLPNCKPQEIFELCSQQGLPVIFTGHDLPLQGAVDLIRQGALDYLDKPFPQSRLLDLLERLDNRQNG